MEFTRDSLFPDVQLAIGQEAPTDSTSAPAPPIRPAPHRSLLLIPYENASGSDQVDPLIIEQASLDAPWRAVRRVVRQVRRGEELECVFGRLDEADVRGALRCRGCFE